MDDKAEIIDEIIEVLKRIDKKISSEAWPSDELKLFVPLIYTPFNKFEETEDFFQVLFRKRLE